MLVVFLEKLAAFKNFLNFLKIYKIKSEIKSSTERTGCDNISRRSGGSSIFLWGKCDRGKFFYLNFFLTFFSSETSYFFVRKMWSWENCLAQNFLLFSLFLVGEVHFLKSHFSGRISIANSFNIKLIPLALAELIVAFYLDIRKPSFFQHSNFFDSSFLMFKLYRKRNKSYWLWPRNAK